MITMRKQQNKHKRCNEFLITQSHPQIGWLGLYHIAHPSRLNANSNIIIIAKDFLNKEK